MTRGSAALAAESEFFAELDGRPLPLEREQGEEWQQRRHQPGAHPEHAEVHREVGRRRHPEARRADRAFLVARQRQVARRDQYRGATPTGHLDSLGCWVVGDTPTLLAAAAPGSTRAAVIDRRRGSQGRAQGVPARDQQIRHQRNADQGKPPQLAPGLAGLLQPRHVHAGCRAVGATHCHGRDVPGHGGEHQGVSDEVPTRAPIGPAERPDGQPREPRRTDREDAGEHVDRDHRQQPLPGRSRHHQQHDHRHHQVRHVGDPLAGVLRSGQLVDAPHGAPSEQDQQPDELHRDGIEREHPPS